ncbi:hypothetical protein CRYUN_Cryun38cG0021000 [Craigia yunnanensis]
MLATQELKNMIQSVDVLKGVVGLELFSNFLLFQRVKVAKGLKGGCLAIGCSVQIVRFDIKEKTNASCIIRSDIAYAVKKKFEVNDLKPNIQLLAAATQIAKRHLESTHNA